MTLTAQAQAQALLRVTSDADLLRKFAHLTHRIDGGPADVRAQRDLIGAEILARMGGTR